MIHVLTVHWLDPRWIPVQLRYLERWIRAPYRTYTLYTGIEDAACAGFDRAVATTVADHATKLNELARMASAEAEDPSDWLVFIDGDAFPIGDVVPFAEAALADHTLVAIQRRENNGDIQPHPSFCVVPVGAWADLAGDWRAGHQWPNAQGALVSDVGGNLLGRLDERGATWRPMLRTNRRDHHPLWFGIYDDLVYHHGAGFRHPESRVDHQAVTAEMARRPLIHLTSRTLDALAAAFARTRGLHRLAPRLRAIHPRKALLRVRREASARQSAEIFARLQEDPDFHRMFL